jgi:hypothetical protein
MEEKRNQKQRDRYLFFHAYSKRSYFIPSLPKCLLAFGTSFLQLTMRPYELLLRHFVFDPHVVFQVSDTPPMRWQELSYIFPVHGLAASLSAFLFWLTSLLINSMRITL